MIDELRDIGEVIVLYGTLKHVAFGVWKDLDLDVAYMNST